MQNNSDLAWLWNIDICEQVHTTAIRQTDRQAGYQTDRQTDGKRKERQRERERERDRETDRQQVVCQATQSGDRSPFDSRVQ